MSRQGKTLVVLAVVLAGCLALYGGLALWGPGEEEETPGTALTALQAVTELSFTTETETLSFTYDDAAGWSSVEYPDFPLNGTPIANLAEDLLVQEAVRVIEDPEEAASYGLEEPVRVITASDGGEEVEISIGSEVNGNYYAGIQGDARVYVIAETLLTDTDFTLNDLAQLEEFPGLGEADLAQLTLAAADGAGWTLEKTEQTIETESSDGDGAVNQETVYTWWQDGQELPSENSDLESLVSTVSGLNFAALAQYDATPAQLEEMGLSTPQLTLTAVREDGETVTLRLGLEGEEGYYALLNDSNNVHYLSSDKAQRLFGLANADFFAQAEETE